MPQARAWRPILLISCSLGLLGALATGSARAVAEGQNAAPGSTSPRVGEPLRASSAEQIALSAHLRARGVRFYGAWWCPACFQQKNLFGREAGNQLPYVECDDDEAGRRRCAAAGIRAYPTWVLEGQPRLEGVQSLAELAAWSAFEPGGQP